MKGVKISLLISPVPLTPPFLHSSVTSLSASPSLCVSSSLFMSLSADSLSLSAIPWTSLSSCSTRHLSDAALVTSIHPAPSAPLTISPVVSGSLASRAISQTHTSTQAHTHGFDLWSRSLPHQQAISAMLFDHTDFYMVIHNLTR